MTLSAGLNKTLNALQPITAASDTERTCYAIVQLIDQLIASRDYVIRPNRDNPVVGTRLELIPASTDAYAVKAEIGALLAEVTEPVRRNLKSTVDLDVLAQAGYPTTIQKISFDEWVITIVTPRGELYTRFIEA